MAEKINFSRRVYLNQYKNLQKDIFISSTPITISKEITNMIMEVDTSIKEKIKEVDNRVTAQVSEIDNIKILPQKSISPTQIFVNKETPQGIIDGRNTTFILQHTPVIGSDHVYLNGLLVEDGTTTDYNITDNIIEFSEPLLPGMKIYCTYYYTLEIQAKVFSDKESPQGYINGVNNIFTLQNIPVEGSEHIYLNGLLQESGIENDYIISDSTIIFNFPLKIESKLRCTYYYYV